MCEPAEHEADWQSLRRRLRPAAASPAAGGQLDGRNLSQPEHPGSRKDEPELACQLSTLWVWDASMLITGLETAHLVIRDVRAPDAGHFYEYMKREQYWRNVPIDTPTNESIADMINRCILDQQKQPRTDFFLAAVDKATDNVIGEAILHVRNLRWRQGEIGWGVNSDRTGRGLATEIGTAMLHLGFNRLGLHRIYAQCQTENLASRRVMAKLGMRQEGVLRQNVLARGSWWSSVQCSILSGERPV